MNNRIYNLLILIALFFNFQVGYSTPSIVPGSDVKSDLMVNPVEDDLEKYVGRYRIEGADFEYATVTLEDEKLYGKAEGQERVELVPQEEKGHFYVPAMDITVRFSHDDQDEVSGVTILTSDQTLRGEKVG